jgi:hypothetical protein
MRISHEEAQRLIQFNADESLDSNEKALLSTHLQDCRKCLEYAEDLKQVESTLSSAMKRHWNFHPTPLLVEVIASRRSSKPASATLLTTRTAVISFVFIAFVFTIWQLALPGRPLSDRQMGALPVPTPSLQTAQFTNTTIAFQDCAEITYKVGENDTLESIADEFSILKEDIMAINQMKTDTVYTAMVLRIPVCTSTPTGTGHPLTLTTTFTPVIHQFTSTPGG